MSRLFWTMFSFLLRILLWVPSLIVFILRVFLEPEISSLINISYETPCNNIKPISSEPPAFASRHKYVHMNIPVYIVWTNLILGTSDLHPTIKRVNCDILILAFHWWFFLFNPNCVSWYPATLPFVVRAFSLYPSSDLFPFFLWWCICHFPTARKMRFETSSPASRVGRPSWRRAGCPPRCSRRCREPLQKF